jgi:hypothetical protein
MNRRIRRAARVVKKSKKKSKPIQRKSHRSERSNVALVASVAPDWPEPPERQAFYGLPGDVVKAIDPHTESDPVGILLQFLVAFGNRVGCSPHFCVEGDRHHTNLFVALVGSTAKARKGTAWGRVRSLMEPADEPNAKAGHIWNKSCIRTGLLSGEGLVWTVRDEGESRDKRLLVVEPEFAQTLKAMERPQNTLSAQLRQAWDSGNLELLSKNSPAKASGAHISVISHSTTEDLRRYLVTVEMANGFANRFLWCCVQRTKFLPEGGDLSDSTLEALATRVRQAVSFAESVGKMQRDNDARSLWYDVYTELSAGTVGLLGAVTGRAEAQVLRLSMTYALLDCSSTIRVEHVAAALAIWKYCEASARYIFGGRTGDRIADKILRELRVHPEGLSRTEIRDLFKRHKSEDQVSSALRRLSEARLAYSQSYGTAGRPVERWFANLRQKRL